MVQSASGFERHNNHLDRSHRHETQCHTGDLFPFDGFIPTDNNDCTPIGKTPYGSVLHRCKSTKSTDGSASTATTKTPPVELSVSPEIQSGLCHTVFASGTTPYTCYGAGHMVSGVTDRRKCRSRGILSVGRTNSFEQDNIVDNRQQIRRKSRPSLIPLPAEASISWRFSQDGDNGIDEKGDYTNGLHQSGKLVKPAAICTSFLDHDAEFQAFLEISGDLVKTPSTPDCKPVHSLDERERTSAYDFTEEYLSSGNVMQTPNSDSGSERHVCVYWREGLQLEREFESELDQATDNNTLQHKNSDLENLLESEIQISWRDGLVRSDSDLDSCRLLSDNENDSDLAKRFSDVGLMEQKARLSKDEKEVNCCAESISTDGGGLIASGDSDWSIYYKNQDRKYR